MKPLYSLLNSILLLIIFSSLLSAQDPLRIGIIKDADSQELNTLNEFLYEEINLLIKPRSDVLYKVIDANWNKETARQNIQIFMTDPEIDLIISIGFISSNELVNYGTYAKPSFAVNILDLELQTLPLNVDYSTGINNFTYIEPVINLSEDFKIFSKIFDIRHLSIIGAEPLKENFPQIIPFIKKKNDSLNVSIVSAGPDAGTTLEKLSEETDAAIVLPLLQFNTNEIIKLFNGLNKRKIITMAPGGIDYVELGASLTMTPKFTIRQLARHTALRILKFVEGANPAGISVSVEQNKRQPVINFASLRTAKKFPPADFLNEALLINVDTFPDGDEITLRGAIAEALKNNLTGKITKEDFSSAEKDVRIAKSNIFPQLEISGTGVELSENLVESSMGQRGEFTITGTVSLNQVIFSEPVFANIAINKLVAENKKHIADAAVLDIITDISNAYLSVLFAQSNLNIQNNNVNATIQNLQIAEAKEASGHTGLSDVNRWKSELSLNKIKLNDAHASFKSSMFNLNSLLNKQIDKSIKLPDSDKIDRSIIIDQNLFSKLFENPALSDLYASFIMSEMKNNSPELKQLFTAGKILDRQRSMHNRQLFLPEIFLFGSVDQVFVRNGTIANPQLPIPPPPDDATWSAGINLRFPLFKGGKTITEIEKSEIEIKKLSYQENELINNFETGIRAGVEKLIASYLEVDLSKYAALAAEDNYKIVQDAYAQGVASLVQLVDAQNVMTQTKHLSSIAFHQYLLDYIQLERLQGKFMFLSSEEEQKVYINRLNNFLVSGE
ncbi:MAG: TolC family protein [Ignavibacteriae bacterium]|jgi:outer membrane protein TolC|nr:TolC family protein [Ignavibacteriota bacterium]NOG97923.1 TolC family protein [Ignavibacteriota bacterium]